MNHRLLARAGALWLAAAAAGSWAAPTPLPPLQVGTQVTALQDGAADVLGLDTAFAPGPGSNVTALTDTDLEFLSADYAIGIDLFSNGLVQLYDNNGAGQFANTVLTLAFAGLATPLGTVLVDSAALAAGTLDATLLDDHTLQLTLTNVRLVDAFGPLSLTLGAAVAAVPEPTPLALLAAAAAGAALLRRRSAAAAAPR